MRMACGREYSTGGKTSEWTKESTLADQLGGGPPKETLRVYTSNEMKKSASQLGEDQLN